MSNLRVAGIFGHGETQIDDFYRKIISLCNKQKLAIHDFKSFTKMSMFLIKHDEEKLEDNLDEELVVHIDGELHNFNELRKRFGLACHKDEGLIKELYRIDPQNFESYLIGNYVIAIFDYKTGNFCLIRDHFGTKPMYYYHNYGLFCYSSEIKYIRCFPIKDLSPNIKKIVNYLTQYKPNSSETFFNEILSLEPSTKLTFDGKSTTLKKYECKQDYSFKGKGIKDAKLQLEENLVKACKSRGAANGTPYTLLSGGLDSSVIHLLMQKINKEDAKSITMNFFDSKDNLLSCDESDYQKLLISRIEDNISIKFKKQSPYSNVDDFLERFDQPFNLANAYLFEEVYKESKNNKIESFFDGVDGDTVISHGWERFDELFSPLSIHTFFYELFMFTKKHNYAEYTNTSLSRRFIVSLARKRSYLKPLILLKRFFSKRKYEVEKVRTRIIKDEYLRKYGFIESYDFSRNYRTHKEKTKNNLIESAFSNLNILYFQYNIKQLSPFFDKRVVDFCVSLPSSFKLRHGSTRYILRETFKNKLPEKILKRYSKANLTENFVNKITEIDFDNILCEMQNIHPFIKPYIDEDVLFSHFKNLKLKSKNEKSSMSIWNFYLVNKWLKINF